jgi:hypothetical protein
MRAFAEEFAAHEHLTGVIFICNTLGHDRDSCTYGFEFPASRESEVRLNRAYTAKCVEKEVQCLSPEDREASLREARRRGLGEWL